MPKSKIVSRSLKKKFSQHIFFFLFRVKRSYVRFFFQDFVKKTKANRMNSQSCQLFCNQEISRSLAHGDKFIYYTGNYDELLIKATRSSTEQHPQLCKHKCEPFSPVTNNGSQSKAVQCCCFHYLPNYPQVA